MQEQFVNYEIALALKELGFNEQCLACYTPHLGKGIFELIGKGFSNEGSAFNERFVKAHAVNGCSAPLYQQVIDWFIKEHDLTISIFKWSVKYYLNDELQTPRFLFDIDTYGDYSDDWVYQSINDDLKYESYHEAMEQSILKTISSGQV